jgi:two-component system sensor histidine kinase KdpD
MIFLVPVIFCAVRFGLWPAIAASILSFLAFDFFFVEPFYAFTISQPQEFVALLVFLVVAVITRIAREQGSRTFFEHARARGRRTVAV